VIEIRNVQAATARVTAAIVLNPRAMGGLDRVRVLVEKATKVTQNLRNSPVEIITSSVSQLNIHGT
jgi:hypothetical protein